MVVQSNNILYEHLLELLASLKMWPSSWRGPGVWEAGCREWTTDGHESGWNFWRDERRVRIIIFHRIGFRVRQQHDEAVLRPAALEIDLAVPVFC